MTAAIEVENLVFEYANKRALHSVSFKIEPASVTALVGPNGAGKTTILRCLAALELPFSGQVKICGLDTQDDPRKIHEKVAYLADFYGLYGQLTVRQCLIHMASIHYIPKGKQKEVIEQVAEELQLTNLLNSLAGNLSRGQRQRLAIAQAIIHKPPVLLLDEPAAGLDPEARHSLSSLITSLQSKGQTLVVSSHILSELEDYSTAMLTVHDGKILAHKKLSDVTTIEKKIVDIDLLELPADFENQINEQSNVKLISRRANAFTLEIEGNDANLHQILQILISKGFKICSFIPRQTSLQDEYLSQVKGKSTENK